MIYRHKKVLSLTSAYPTCAHMCVFPPQHLASSPPQLSAGNWHWRYIRWDENQSW